MNDQFEWYAVKDGEKLGPLNWMQLRELVIFGKIEASSYVWREGLENWISARSVPGLIDLSGLQSSKPTVQTSVSASAVRSLIWWSSLALGLLALGLIGAAFVLPRYGYKLAPDPELVKAWRSRFESDSPRELPEVASEKAHEFRAEITCTSVVGGAIPVGYCVGNNGAKIQTGSGTQILTMYSMMRSGAIKVDLGTHFSIEVPNNKSNMIITVNVIDTSTGKRVYQDRARYGDVVSLTN